MKRYLSNWLCLALSGLDLANAESRSIRLRYTAWTSLWTKWMPLSRRDMSLLMLATTLVTSAQAAEDAPIRVRLSTPQTTYLVGETVRLDLVVENVARREIRIDYVPTRELQAQGVSIATGGVPFKQWFVEGIGFSPREWKVLKPQSILAYRIRVLYSPFPKESRLVLESEGRILPGGIAFDRPGKYSLRVDYPASVENPAYHETVASNAVEVEVEEPKGVDADVRRRINSVEVLKALQFDFVGQGESSWQTVLDTLEAFPETSYGPALRQALRHHFRSHREDGSNASQQTKESRRIDGLMRLPANARELFMEDDRLDAVLVPEKPQGRSIGDALETFSKQWLVSLECSTAVARLPYSPPERKLDLRSVMQDLATAAKGQWRRDGEGYLLKSLEEWRKEALQQREELRKSVRPEVNAREIH